MTSDGLFRVAAALEMALCMSPSFAQKYDTGATDTEIKIGQTNPFSGPASAYATSARRRQPI